MILRTLKLTRKLGWVGSLLMGMAVVASAQIKLEPVPFLEQCAKLASDATSDKTLKPALAAFHEKDLALRVKAAQTLGKSCHQQAVAPLVAALQDASPLIRAAAVTALGQLGDRESVEDLRLILGEPDWRVRMALVQTLASFKIFNARNAVLNGIANPNDAVIFDETDLRVRCVAILTVNQLTDVSFSRKAVLFVYGFLESPHAQVRQIAEQTMVALKETHNAPIELVAILKAHNNPEMRRWAAVWLGKLSIERGRDQLIEASTNDASPAVKQAAAHALTLMK